MLSDGMIRVRRVTRITSSEVEAFVRLLPQLSPRLGGITAERAAAIVAAPCTVLFVAEAGTEIVDMLSLVWYDVPSGRKGWIEDVVVDAAVRRRGVGEALLEEALRIARCEGVERLQLTSSPSREAARALYRKLGFEEMETGVFVFKADTK